MGATCLPRAGSLALLCSLTLTLLVACRRTAPTPPNPSEPQQLRFSADSTQHTFVYADAKGALRQVSRTSSVPQASRRVVGILESASRGFDDLYVSDLTTRDATGVFTARRVSRTEFERRAVAHLPPGRTSRIQIRRHGADTSTHSWTRSHVVVYGTSWCAACLHARRFLSALGVHFEYRDVERNAEHAAELASKAKHVGVVPDRVPMIEVRTRLLVGFAPERLSTLLGDQI